MMSSQTQHKKRSYSFIYKIYRRIRFVRHKKKTIKKNNLELKQNEIRELNEKRTHLQDFILSEKQNKRLKLKAERKESKNYKRNLKEEFRQRKQLDKLEWVNLSIEEKKRKKQARIDAKIERKRRIRHNLKFQLGKFMTSFRSINIRNFKRKLRDFRKNAPERRLFALISFNSTVLYLLAYFSLFFISQIITVIAASFFDYPTTVYYYEIYFNISPESWFHDSVKTIFSSGPLVVFVIGIIFLILYNNIREDAGAYKLFFLWGYLHAVNMLFGAMLVGSMFETGVGYVVSWMYIMDTGKVLYSVISIFLLVLAGLVSTKQFLISANTYHNEINQNNRNSFIIAQVFMPYLAGNVFLILLRQPRFVFYDTFIGITLIICIIPILVTYRSFNELYFEEDEKKPQLALKGMAILLLLLLIFRGALGIGLRFGG